MSMQKNSEFFLGNWGRILSHYGECQCSYYGKFVIFMLGLFSGYYVLCGGDPESKVKGNASHEGILLVIGNV